MSCWFKRFDLPEPPCSSLWFSRTSSFFADDDADSHLAFAALDSLTPTPTPFLINAFADDLFSSPAAAFRRFQDRAEAELSFRSLTDRIAALETGFVRALKPKALDRKYKWTAEIKGGEVDSFDRKYTLTALAKAGEPRSLKMFAEFKGIGRDARDRTYTFESLCTTDAEKKKPEKDKEKVKEKKKGSDAITTSRIVEIVDEPNPGIFAIKKAFAVSQSKGKRKVLSEQDAAVFIQLKFRDHLFRRRQVLRSLRELAVAKAKLKEVRYLFFNLSYRRLTVNDAEERQKFAKKIIDLLLTVEALEGPDYMVRVAKKKMIDELEVMLEVVDPQLAGKLGWIKRKMVKYPNGGPISKEVSMGVAEFFQMVNEEE